MSLAKFHKEIREMCEAKGWDVFQTFNDKHKDGSRRVSYMRNGWRLPTEMKLKILVGAQEIVKKHNVNGTVYWRESERMGYGYYDKLCVDIDPYTLLLGDIAKDA